MRKWTLFPLFSFYGNHPLNVPFRCHHATSMSLHRVSIVSGTCWTICLVSSVRDETPATLEVNLLTQKIRLTWATYHSYYMESHLVKRIWEFKRRQNQNGNPSKLVQHKTEEYFNPSVLESPCTQKDLLELSINWWKSGRNVCYCRSCLLRRWLICIGTFLKHFVNDIN